MRRIVEAIRQCPEVTGSDGVYNVAIIHQHPPSILEWDVLASSSLRAPFQGYVLFDLPKDAQETEEAKRSKELHLKFQSLMPVFSKFMKYRYEFDLGPDAPELRKALLRFDAPNFSPYDPSPNSEGYISCWDKIARSPGSIVATHDGNTQASAEKSNERNRTAIRAEFVELATSHEKGTINFWYSLTNTTDADYKIDSLDEITTAGMTVDHSLYSFNRGISFEVPLIIPAHRNAKAIFHFVPSIDLNLSVHDDASANAVAKYKNNVMNYLRSKYAGLKGFAILDEKTRYEIDFFLP
jgi:hypothetical protein